MLDLTKQRILVTGGHGFLGKHVCERLSNVAGEMWAPSHDELDLLSEYDTRQAIDEQYKPEVVIHLAAYCGGIGLNQAKPSELFSYNLEMGMNVIRACWWRRSKLVIVGSVCSYPKNCAVPFKESDLWNGFPDESNASYGVAKKVVFEMARSYQQQYGADNHKYACLLPANLYGPGDHFDLENSHVIPAIIRKMVEAKESGAPSVTLWGTGKATREFLYVEDCADAIVRAAAMIDSPEPINIGAGDEISILRLAHLIKELVGYDGAIEWDHTKPDGQPRRCLDTTRAKSLLDWEASTTLVDGLKRTIAWYTAQRATVGVG